MDSDVQEKAMEAMHIVRTLRTLAGNNQDEPLEQLTGADLYFALKPVEKNLEEILTALSK